MAQIPALTTADRWFAQLNASVDASITSWVLKASGATNLPTRTVVHCDSEKVLVTAIDIDTPSAGLDTLTVERGYGDTTAATHDADDYVGMFNSKEFFNETSERLYRLEQWAIQRMGGGDGVVRDGLKVTAQGSPDMTVNVSPGCGAANGHPVSLTDAVTLTFTAPSGNPRIDSVQIDQWGVVSVKTGAEAASPTAATVDTDAEKLAEVYHTTAETSIKDADDATNGYITDSRTFV